MQSKQQSQSTWRILPLQWYIKLTKGSREQLAIAEFANALLVIPKTLAVNAAKDSTDLVSKLRAFHNIAQLSSPSDPKHQLKWTGLELIHGGIRDNIKAGVMEPVDSKIKSLKAATEAAIALLRIDDLIKIDKPQAREDDCH